MIDKLELTGRENLNLELKSDFYYDSEDIEAFNSSVHDPFAKNSFSISSPVNSIPVISSDNSSGSSYYKDVTVSGAVSSTTTSSALAVEPSGASSGRVLVTDLWGHDYADARNSNGYYFCDAEKEAGDNDGGGEDWGNTDDDLLCWAATTANMLQWAGWGNAAQGQFFRSADDILQHFEDHWTDNGGYMGYGLEWWLTGSEPQESVNQTDSGWAHVNVDGGGGFAPSVSFASVVSDTYQIAGGFELNWGFITDAIDTGQVIGLTLQGDLAHAITCWGYEVSGGRKYLYYSDSDDDKDTSNGVTAPNKLYRTEIKLEHYVESDGTIYQDLIFNMSDYFSNGHGVDESYQGRAYIWAATALKQYDSDMEGISEDFSVSRQMTFSNDKATRRGNVDCANDTDYYSFDINAKGVVTISVTALVNASTDFFIYDQTQTLIASITGAVNTYELLAGENSSYYIVVEGLSYSASDFTYTVNLEYDEGWPDTDPPSTPLGLTQTVNGANVFVNWEDSDDGPDGSGVKLYEVRVDDDNSFSSVNYTKKFSVSEGNLSKLIDGTYFWQVRAQDNFGNWSEWSEISGFVVDTIAPDVPSQLTETVIGNTLAMDWADSSDGEGTGLKEYEVQVAGDNRFKNVSYTYTYTDSECVINGVADGSYFWRVRAKDNAGNWSDWSAASDFVVDVTAPEKPENLTEESSRGRLNLAWNESVDAGIGLAGYKVQYSTDENFTAVLGEEIVLVNKAVIKDLADGKYYWRVQAFDANNNVSDWTVGGDVVVDTVGPDKPDVSGITVINGSNAQLNWAVPQDASGISIYTVWVYTEMSPSAGLGIVGGQFKYDPYVTTNCCNISDLSDGVYNWRVRAQDSAGNWSEWSDIGQFTVDLEPASVPMGLVQTVNGANVNLDWNDSLDKTGLSGYDVQVSSSRDFNPATVSKSVTESQAVVNGLTDGIYFWRVRSVDDQNNYSAWSAPGNFSVDLIGDTFATAKNLTLVGNAAGAVGGVGLGDAQDVYKFTVDIAGEFDFALTELESKAKLNLYYEYDSNGVTKYRKLKGTNSKTDRGTGETFAAFDNILLDVGTYYVEVVSGDNGRGRENTNYDLSIEGDFFPAQSIDEFDFRNGVGTPTELILDADADASASDWVGFGDAQDVYKFTVGTAGEFDFALTDLDAKTSFNLYYEYDSNGVTKYRKLKGTNSKTDRGTGETFAAFDNILLDVGTYYVEVLSGDKGRGRENTNYDLSIEGDFFPAQSIDEFDFRNGVGAPTELVLNADADASTSGWVGFGDAQDVYKFTVGTAGEFDFALTDLDAKTSFNLYYEYESNGVTKYRKLKGTNSKTDRGTGETFAALDDILLDVGTYYVEVLSGDKGRGRENTNYDLSIEGDFFPAQSIDEFDFRNGVGTPTELILDADADASASDWVGFGDAQDVYKFTVGTAGEFDFALTDLDAKTSFNLYYEYESNGVTKYRKLKGTNSRTDNVTGKTAAYITDSELDAGTYYLEVLSGDKGKGKYNSAYNLNINGDLGGGVPVGSLNLDLEEQNKGILSYGL